jgi:hypothetical protein
LVSGEEMAKTTKDKLLQKGFQFKYITHIYTNKKGNTYFFVMTWDTCLWKMTGTIIVRRKED